MSLLARTLPRSVRAVLRCDGEVGWTADGRVSCVAGAVVAFPAEGVCARPGAAIHAARTTVSANAERGRIRYSSFFCEVKIVACEKVGCGAYFGRYKGDLNAQGQG